MKGQGDFAPAFLEGVPDIAFGTKTNFLVKFSTCMAVGSIYSIRNLNLVLPCSFLSSCFNLWFLGGRL